MVTESRPKKYRSSYIALGLRHLSLDHTNTGPKRLAILMYDDDVIVILLQYVLTCIVLTAFLTSAMMMGDTTQTRTRIPAHTSSLLRASMRFSFTRSLKENLHIRSCRNPSFVNIFIQTSTPATPFDR